MIFGAYWSKHKNEFSIFLNLFFFKYINNFFIYFILTSYDGDPSSIHLYLAIFLFLNNTISILLFLTGSVFLLRMCDIEYAGIFMTFFYSLSNFGALWTFSTSLFLLDPLGLNLLLIILFIYNILFFVFWRKRLLIFEKSDKAEWTLNYHYDLLDSH